jgi:hypothetical protein
MVNIKKKYAILLSVFLLGVYNLSGASTTPVIMDAKSIRLTNVKQKMQELRGMKTEMENNRFTAGAIQGKLNERTWRAGSDRQEKMKQAALEVSKIRELMGIEAGEAAQMMNQM